MSALDKIRNATQDLAGKAKQATGRMTNRRGTEAEGRHDQTKADLKSAGEKLKDAGGNASDAVGH